MGTSFKTLILFSTAAILSAGPAYADLTWYDPVTGQPVSQQPADSYSPPMQIDAPSDALVQAPITQAEPASGSSLADDVIFSGEVGAVTSYTNRGVSRSDGPALQGRARLGYNGVYGGVSGSTVDLDMDDDALVETMLFGGYQGVFDDLDYDARLSYTAYPGADNEELDYWEFALTGGYDFDVFYGSVTWAISPNYINDSGVTLYYGGDLSAPLPIASNIDLTARAHLGFQFAEHSHYVDKHITDWGLGVYYTIPEYDIDLGVNYTGTDADDDDCVEDCGSRIGLSVGKSFGQSSKW